MGEDECEVVSDTNSNSINHNAIMRDLDPNDPQFIPPSFHTAIESVENLATDQAMPLIFPKTNKYPSQKHVKLLMIAYGDTKGFHVSVQLQAKLICSRGGTNTYSPSTKSQEKHQNNNMIVHC